MISPCPYVCDNKTAYGYCKTTACIYNKVPIYTGPSHMCSLCFKQENPHCVTITKEFWVCDDCLKKLRKLIKD